MEKIRGKRDLGGVTLACWDHVEFEMSTEHQNGDPDQGRHTIWGSERFSYALSGEISSQCHWPEDVTWKRMETEETTRLHP